MKVSICSFDIWDTVLRRAVHPEDVKLSTCAYIVDKYSDVLMFPWTDWDLYRMRLYLEHTVPQLRPDTENDATFIEVFAILLRLCFRNDYIEIASVVEDLRDFEYQYEARHTYLDPGITQIIKMRELSNYLIFISDFYHNEEFIRGLLIHHGVNNYFKKGFVSCDVQRTKRSGGLFEHVRDVFDDYYILSTHIGDNIHSDVTVGERYFDSVVHYMIKSESEKLTRNERKWRFRKKYSILKSLLSSRRNPRIMLHDGELILVPSESRKAQLYYLIRNRLRSSFRAYAI